MIRIQTFRNAKGQETGFRSKGHADFDEAGRDIICAAVSVLELNLANSLEELTEARFTCEQNERKGSFSLRLIDEEDPQAVLLLRSCILGFRAVSEAYGSNYLTITDQEV